MLGYAENAGHQFGGPNRRTWKCRTRKYSDGITAVPFAPPEMPVSYLLAFRLITRLTVKWFGCVYTWVDLLCHPGHWNATGPIQNLLLHPDLCCKAAVNCWILRQPFSSRPCRRTVCKLRTGCLYHCRVTYTRVRRIKCRSMHSDPVVWQQRTVTIYTMCLKKPGAVFCDTLYCVWSGAFPEKKRPITECSF